MSGGNYQGRQSMDANQRLPQHNADHVPMRTYKEISNAPEHVSFASHHQATCWTPIKATLHDAKCLFDLEGPIISWVHQTHTLWPRRHDQPPTIGLSKHNDKHEWSTSANLQDIRGRTIWINQQHTSWQRSYSRQCHDMTPDDRPLSCTRTWLRNR